MVSFPVSAADIDVSWMNEALAAGGKLGGRKVVGCKARDSEVPGQTAEIILVDVEYDDAECHLPRRFVAKVSSRNPVVVEQVIKVYDLYRREAAFYSEFDDPGINAPDCYLCRHDPATQQLVILMADLAPAESPSWAPTPDQTELALAQLPAFHAKWWNDPKLRALDWLVQFDNRDFFFAGATAANLARPLMDEHFGDGAAHTAALMTIYLEHIDALLAYVATRPFTFVHGDYHPKQMFFPTEKGGHFAVIDWQFPFVGQGAWDFVRMMVLGLDVDERRARQDRLVDTYYQGLLEAGIQNYLREDLDIDMKLGLLVNQMIMSVALIDTDISILSRECDALGIDWKDVMISRGEAALRDWDVVSFAESIV